MAETVPALSIPPDKVCFVVMKAREFEVEDLPAVSDNGSNPADDREPAMLEDRGDDPVVQELAGFVSAMSVDERIDLVALAWLGRGDGGLNEWGSCARRRRVCIPSAPPTISSAFHCCPSSWRRRSRSSASPARNSSATTCRVCASALSIGIAGTSPAMTGSFVKYPSAPSGRSWSLPARFFLWQARDRL